MSLWWIKDENLFFSLWWSKGFYREDHHVHMKFVLKDAFMTRCYFMTYDEGFPLTGDSEVVISKQQSSAHFQESLSLDIKQ